MIKREWKITKSKDLEGNRIYSLYVNGSIEGCYVFSQIEKKFPNDVWMFNEIEVSK